MVNRPIGYWVRRLDTSLEMQLDATLARLRLSRRQWQVLSALSSGPVTPADVADILRPFNTSNAADGGDAQERDMAALVRQQLVSLLDGHLALTDAGSALHSEASGLLEAARYELTAGIGADEYAMAVSVLERMSNNADRLGMR
ncbi:DNA-binding MarR family transcriptional regulator [Arthrobacter sp. CG_A4]|nr:DNA-binding MarR family transcriptional regulator [Arthrobacter sp. CG_A4]